MKPHKHAEIIKAWADGAEIQSRVNDADEWDDDRFPAWHTNAMYRIKPEPKPDISLAYFANPRIEVEEDGPSIEWTGTWKKCNLRLTFDGETGELKAAEVVK